MRMTHGCILPRSIRSQSPPIALRLSRSCSSPSRRSLTSISGERPPNARTEAPTQSAASSESEPKAACWMAPPRLPRPTTRLVVAGTESSESNTPRLADMTLSPTSPREFEVPFTFIRPACNRLVTLFLREPEAVSPSSTSGDAQQLHSGLRIDPYIQ